MSKAFNLSQLANNVSSGGLLDGAAVNGAVATATNATNATNAVNATNATNAVNATNATKITNAGGWSVTPSGTKLYFNYNGTNVASLDSSGEFIALGNVTAYGTP